MSNATSVKASGCPGMSLSFFALMI